MALNVGLNGSYLPARPMRDAGKHSDRLHKSQALDLYNIYDEIVSRCGTRSFHIHSVRARVARHAPSTSGVGRHRVPRPLRHQSHMSHAGGAARRAPPHRCPLPPR